MTITLEQIQGDASLTVLGIQGDLDASNYQGVIQAAEHALGVGNENLLIDMTEIPFMSSAGIAALHSIAMLMRGDEKPDTDHGWEVFHSYGRESGNGKQKNVKLLNPQPRVLNTLAKTGMDEFFEIYTDIDTAIASFSMN